MSGSRPAVVANAAIASLGTCLAHCGGVPRISILIALLAGSAALPAATARAENCVDKRKLTPGDTRRPCWDIAATFGRAETYVTQGRAGLYVNTRLTGPYMFFKNNGRTLDDQRAHTGIRIDFGSKEILNLGDGEFNFYQVAGMRYQRDLPNLGGYVGGFAVSKWHERYRILTPTAGLRIGNFAQAALVAEVRMPGLYLIGTGEQSRSLTTNFDLSLRGTYALRRYLRLEGRARFRNFTVDEEMRQSDVMLSAGVEGAIPGKLGFRITPTFIGVGVRFVDHHDEWKYHPVRERHEFIPVEDRGIELMVLVDIDSAVNSTAAIW